MITLAGKLYIYIQKPILHLQFDFKTISNEFQLWNITTWGKGWIQVNIQYLSATQLTFNP